MLFASLKAMYAAKNGASVHLAGAVGETPSSCRRWYGPFHGNPTD